MAIDIVLWSVAGLVTVIAVIGLVPRRYKQPGGRARGAHAKAESDTPAARREAWHEMRQVLLYSGGLAIVLLSNDKHLATARIMGFLVVALGIWDVVAWLRLRDPKERAKAFSGLRFLVAAVLFNITILLGGWPDETAKVLFVLAGLIVVGPDLDSWFRGYTRRRSAGNEASDPPQ